MSESKGSSAAGGGIGFAGLLTTVFITLKLIGEHFHTPVADWPWWLVFIPLWGGLALVIGIAIIVFIVAVVVTMFKK